jgi:hypothetical protein
MPRKPKSTAKSAPKTSSSYANPLPPSLQSHPPISTSNGKTSSKSSYDAQLAEWTAKNARAKAIIMSTLVPGSEPWQIAEPLEYAADIWKALEEKYGPKSGERDGNEDEASCEEILEQTREGAWQNNLTGNQLQAEDDLAQEVSDGLEEVADLWTRGQEKDTERSNAVNTGVTEEDRKWSDDSMRDQRFLWALLNGGKEEEIDQADEIEDGGTAG